jgi:hypothetical protein
MAQLVSGIIYHAERAKEKCDLQRNTPTFRRREFI